MRSRVAYRRRLGSRVHNRIKRSARHAAVSVVPHVGQRTARLVVAVTSRFGGSAHGYALALLSAADGATDQGKHEQAMRLRQAAPSTRSLSPADLLRAPLRTNGPPQTEQAPVEPAVKTYRRGREYQEAGQWAAAAAAFHRATTLNPTNAEWGKRFYYMQRKAPSWGFEASPYRPAWAIEDYPDRTTSGMVAPLDRKLVAGWLPPGDDNRISFCLNEVAIAEAYATKQVELVDGNTYLEFTRSLQDLWSYAGDGDVLTVRARGLALPIIGSGLECRIFSGPTRADDLFSLLDQGYVFNKYGRVRKSIRIDREWQEAVLDTFGHVRDDLHANKGITLFPFFGTMLGAVRDGDYIGHDNDFDTVYISAHQSPQAVKAEFIEICRHLLDGGYSVEARKSCARVRTPGRIDDTFDIFFAWFDAEDHFNTSYGHHGPPVRRSDDFFTFRSAKLGDFDIPVPANAEEILRQIYGEGWREPDPGFTHFGATRVIDRQFQLRPNEITELHWRQFYRDHDPGEASPFAHFVADRFATPGTIVEFGCGSGRDSLYLASQGWTAVATDRSPGAIERATSAASHVHADGSLHYDIVDSTSSEEIRSCLARHSKTLAEVNELIVYMRFFLHAIDSKTERTLLDTLAGALPQGFVLCAEFRTLADRDLAKAHGDHFRRYIDHKRLAKRLSTKYGFIVEHLEAGQGLSPFRGEDPHLARLVARMPAHQR